MTLMRVLYVPGSDPWRPPAIRMGGGTGLAIGLEELWEASREQRQDLVATVLGRRPGTTEAQALAVIEAMSPGDRYLLLLRRHPDYDDLGVHAVDHGEPVTAPDAWSGDNWGKGFPR